MDEKLMFDEDLKEIYDKLMDEESRTIFANRVLFSLLGDAKYIRNIVIRTSEGQELAKNLENSNENKYVFGAGAWGKELVNIWDGMWSGFLDNNKDMEGKIIGGLKVFRPEAELLQNAKIYISSRLYYHEIKEQLMACGVKEENIVNVGKQLDVMASRQYFDLKELPKNEGEVFVDVGSFDGKTSLQFMKWCEKWEQIYCFEADERNRTKCQETLKDVEHVTIIPKCAWSSDEGVRFNSVGTGSSAIGSEGELMSSTRIDDELSEKKVTFIKMDIEGAEMEALKGAQKVIAEQKPKLAIAVYHKKSDIFNILNLINTYNPNYKFYLRHYSLTDSETVLYAV